MIYLAFPCRERDTATGFPNYSRPFVVEEVIGDPSKTRKNCHISPVNPGLEETHFRTVGSR